MRCIPSVMLVVLLAACSGGSSSDGPSVPFQFRTSEQVPVTVQVQKYGQPVEGASVAIVQVYDPATPDDDSAAEAQGDVYFEGGTDTAGRCESAVSIPATVDHVDVIVQAADSTGPWTKETLRQRWGPFAPTSRVTVRVDQLDGLTIDLEDR